MTQITNDQEFKQALSELGYKGQRIAAARFVNNALDLSTDQRINTVIQTAMNENASDEELADALKSARAATIDCHTRCGSEGDWKEQAGYFLARAAVAALTPESQARSGGPALQAAMSCRMARTSEHIESEQSSNSDESAQQYRILSEIMNS